MGYALAAVKAADFFKGLKIAWNMELKEKYPLEESEKESIQTRCGRRRSRIDAFYALYVLYVA